MDTKALRQKILDLAIRGKLVPQDPNDEPASVLLERIREQKKQMVKEGKLKAKDIKNDTIIFVGEDNLHYEKFQDGTVKCIEDEIPFEVPEGWAWSRLQSIAIIQSSKRVFEKDYVNDGIPFYRSKEIGDLSRNEEIRSQLFITEAHYLELKEKYGAPQIGDILITSVGSIGNTWICDGRQFYYKDGNITQIVANSLFVSEYVQFFLKTDYFFEQVGKTVSGSAYNALTIEKLKNILFALPPYNEQQQIVNVLKPYNELIEKFDVCQLDLLQLLSKTKSKILDLAIRGKLVPQDPNDEPASVLLERIRAEKEELIKQGKIKRDKKESIIFRSDDNSYYRYKGEKEICIDDDLPYELPDGWTWAILPEVVLFQEGPGILKKDFRDEGIPLIRISGLQSDKVLLDGCNYLDPVMVEDKWKHFKLELGDIILCTSASIGKASIVGPEAVGAIPYTGQIRFKMTKSLIRQYFLYFANSNTYLNQINRMKTGNCIQHYGPTHLKEVYIPIPPIKEQERIVKQLSLLLSALYEIEENITT